MKVYLGAQQCILADVKSGMWARWKKAHAANPTPWGPALPSPWSVYISQEEWAVADQRGTVPRYSRRWRRQRHGPWTWEQRPEKWAGAGFKTDSINCILGEYSVDRDTGKAVSAGQRVVWSSPWPMGCYQWIWKLWFKCLQPGCFPFCFLVS